MHKYPGAVPQTAVPVAVAAASHQPESILLTVPSGIGPSGPVQFQHPRTGALLTVPAPPNA